MSLSLSRHTRAGLNPRGVTELVNWQVCVLSGLLVEARKEDFVYMSSAILGWVAKILNHSAR